MPAKIIDGMAIAQQIKSDVQQRVREWAARGKTIHLTAILVGGTPAGELYAQRQAHVELYLIADNKVLAKETEGKWYPAISHAADAQTDASLWVISPNDRDVACMLRVYRWKTNSPSG